MNAHNPVMVYDFAAFSLANPMSPIPGDRLAAQFYEHAAVMNEIIATLNVTGARLVTKGDMDPSVYEDLQRKLFANLQPMLDQAVSAAAQAIAAQASVAANAMTALNAANASADAINFVLGKSNELGNDLHAMEARTVTNLNRLDVISSDATNDENDAAYAAALASDYAVLAGAWAEHMPDTIPPNILAIMNITGDHWSSRWWSNQASQAVSGIGQSVLDAARFAAAAAASAAAAAASLASFQELYLGNHVADPTLDNNGNVLKAGALYFNTTTNFMRNYNGTAWQNIPSGAGITDAPANGNSYGRRNNAWAIVAGGGPPEAPADGNVYGRRDLAWVINNIPTTIAWGAITGIPATFPPSAHTHPISEVVNLQTTLDAEVTNRTAGDAANLAAINLKADKANPAFTGTATFVNQTTTGTAGFAGASSVTGSITAPTRNPGDATLNAATTAFVSQALSTITGTTISLSTAPPSAPKNGALWWQSDTGLLFIFYDDGNSQQWVAPSPTTAAAILSSLFALSPTLAAGDVLVASGPDTLTKQSGALYRNPLDTGGGYRNKIINGNFDIWQYGVSQTVSGYGSVSRWGSYHLGSTKTLSQQSFTLGQTTVPGNPTFFARTVVASVANAGNFVQHRQPIEGVATLNGRLVTVTFYAKADAPKSISTEFYQNFGLGGSPSPLVTGIGVNKVALTTAWQKFSYTTTIPSVAGMTRGTDGNDCLVLVFWLDAGANYNARTNSLGQQSGTFDIAHVSVVDGDATAEADPFAPRDYATETMLCLRFYEGQILSLSNVAVATSSQQIPMRFTYAVGKRRQPAVADLTLTGYSGTGSLAAAFSALVNSQWNACDASAGPSAANTLGSASYSLICNVEIP